MGDSFFGFDTNLPPDPASPTTQRTQNPPQAPALQANGPATRVIAPPPGLGHLGPAPGHPAFRDPVRRSNHHGHSHHHHHGHHHGGRGGRGDVDDDMEDARNDETFGAVDSIALDEEFDFFSSTRRAEVLLDRPVQAPASMEYGQLEGSLEGPSDSVQVDYNQSIIQASVPPPPPKAATSIWDTLDDSEEDDSLLHDDEAGEDGSLPIFNYQDLLLAGGGSTAMGGDRIVTQEEPAIQHSLGPHHSAQHPHMAPPHLPSTPAVAHPPPMPPAAQHPHHHLHQGYPPPSGVPYPGPDPAHASSIHGSEPATSSGRYSMEEIEAALLRQQDSVSHPGPPGQAVGPPPPSHHPTYPGAANLNQAPPYPAHASHIPPSQGPGGIILSQNPPAPSVPHTTAVSPSQSKEGGTMQGEAHKDEKKKEEKEEKKGEEPVSPEVEKARRAQKEKLEGQLKRMSEYDGMMSQGDKEYIQKVQIAQLVGEEGDDFYCQMYLAVRRLLPPSSSSTTTGSKAQGGGPNQGATGGPGERRNGSGEGGGRSRMQQQIQRIVQDARARTKKSQVSKEGALGKVSILSARNPKQSLQIGASKAESTPSSPKEGAVDAIEAVGFEKGEEGKVDAKSPAPLLSSINATSATPGSSTDLATSGKRAAIPTDTVMSAREQRRKGRHEALLATERVYELVLGLEQMVRTRPAPPRSSLDEEGYEATMQWNEQYEREAQRLLGEMGLVEASSSSSPSSPTEGGEGASEAASTEAKAERISRGYDRFIGILSTGKGKRLLPRVLRHCTVDQAYGVAKGVAEVLERLDVCSSLPPRQDVEQVELYMSMVHPAFMSLLAEAGPTIILDLWASLMNRGAVAVQWLARTKPGLGFLTMCMSRAQLLREAGALEEEEKTGGKEGASPNPIPSPASTARWEHLYLQLLTSLRGHFASLFPAPASLPSPPAPGPGPVDPMGGGGAEEEAYVWQFLSLMAVGARDVGVEPQHILVSEVRDRVHDAVWSATHRARSPEDAAQRILNVNLFLHPLHLDASQVAG